MARRFSKELFLTTVQDMTTNGQDRTAADEEDHTLLQHSQPKMSENTKGRPWPRRKLHMLILYATNLISLALLSQANVQKPERNLFKQNTPLWDLVEHETVVFLDNIHELSPFQGPPDDIKDELWDRLYRNTSTTVLEAERAKRLPNSTMVAPGTQRNGIVSLEVFHQLHCLNALRKSLYPERFPDYSVFFPNGTRNHNISIHHDHCVDRIRQATMCDTNLGASFWRWSAPLGKWSINMRTTQTCRNFEKIRLWAVERNLLDWDPSVPGKLTDE